MRARCSCRQAFVHGRLLIRSWKIVIGAAQGYWTLVVPRTSWDQGPERGARAHSRIPTARSTGINGTSIPRGGAPAPRACRLRHVLRRAARPALWRAGPGALRPAGARCRRGGGLRAGQVDPRQPLRRLPRLQRRALPAQPRFPCRRDARRQSRAGLRDARAGRRNRHGCSSTRRAMRRGAQKASTRCSTSAPRLPRPSARPACSTACCARSRRTPGPAGGVLPKDRFDFSLDRAQQCPAIEGMDAYERKHPEWGMPFGLPALSPAEHDALARWIEAGAPAARTAPLPPEYEQRVARWETFLNADSLKAQLASRYIFEHWFIAHLYFDDLPRASTETNSSNLCAPGRRPASRSRSSPRAGRTTTRAWPRAYYRLRRVSETLLAKTHMPYALNDARLARLKAWFIDAPYEVERPALATRRRWLQSVRRVPRAAGRGALPADARGGAVHADGLHQGPGVPRPGRGRRHQRPLLGDVRAARRGTAPS